MVDTSSQTNYLITVKKNLNLQKSKTEKILNSLNKKPVRLIDNSLKNLSHESEITKPLTSSTKSSLYKPKKIKINIHTVLFPYKKLEDEILHKMPVEKQLTLKKSKINYDIQSVFKRTEDTTRLKRDISTSTFPMLTPQHKRTHTVSNFKEITAKKNKINVKSLLGNYMTNVNNPRIKEKRSLLKKVTNISQEFNLLNKLQNERLKELIFK
jgi:hypothetical protein